LAAFCSAMPALNSPVLCRMPSPSVPFVVAIGEGGSAIAIAAIAKTVSPPMSGADWERGCDGWASMAGVYQFETTPHESVGRFASELEA